MLCEVVGEEVEDQQLVSEKLTEAEEGPRVDLLEETTCTASGSWLGAATPGPEGRLTLGRTCLRDALTLPLLPRAEL